MIKCVTIAARARLEKRMQMFLKTARDIGKKKAQAAGDVLSDWHDNFALDQLDREYQMLNRRIAALGDLIANCRMIEPAEQNDAVAIGTTVEYTMRGREQVAVIGCSFESDISLDLVPYDTPLGSFLMGLRSGQTKQGPFIDGPVSVTVTKIHPPSFRYNELQKTLDAKADAQRLPNAADDI